VNELDNHNNAWQKTAVPGYLHMLFEKQTKLLKH